MGSEQLSPRSYKLDRLPSGTPYITLKTASPTPVYLTRYYPTDVRTLQEALSHDSVADRLISVPKPYTIAAAQYWINLQLGPNGNLPLQVIRASDPATGPLIGSCSLLPLNPQSLNESENELPLTDAQSKENGKEAGEREYELGYYLHPDWAGSGIMTAAVEALISWGRHEHGASPIVRVHEENVQSRRVVERFKEFVRVEERDEVEEWPLEKGGGQKKLLVWKWKDELSS